MSRFLDRILGSRVEVDLVRAQFESRLSFQGACMDKELLQAYAEKGRLGELGGYMQEALSLSDDHPIPVQDEIGLIQQYIDFASLIKEEDFHVQFNTKVDDIDVTIEPFILFPLIQNAMKNAYATMEKFPIKIRVSATEAGVLLEVSNRVNHYVENQADDELIRFYKQRLQLAYPDKHELFLSSNSNTFKATLFLKY